jgi:hypothetical protein
MQEEDGRGAQNQREFRYANSRLVDVMTGPNEATDGQLIAFLCECADGKCLGRIQITARRYGATHLDNRDYVILPGHLRIAGEEILEENEYYEVVKKAA